MNKEPCKVLVVDEDRQNADTTVVLLQMWGHEAEPAYSADDAISKAKVLDPDVILLDLGRAVVHGFDIAKELRRSCPSAKLVAITAFSATDIVRRTRDAGFEKVLPRTSSAERLKAAVDAECAATSSEA